ncbi:PucR family transcriptional regulator [Gordonia hongkongensis]|uniref:PucR family transcriptional regulator n=1 Tax=Gordonia hongkongensis TaxID=1701090 RepID=A0AAX3T3N4_9ACTN|nr:PucR family transcriptional regulator [Gordonia hongkongensis]QIK47216.1 PucR family transcriptional regulator [Gordonia terrae]WFP23751.1 PucR family transcriptional regulator [Gordonia hongkongensis]
MTLDRPPTDTATPTLREILDDHLAVAEPRVLSGHERLDAPVRWVHSSEIYEIGPLLTGGELLLTTGLGLRGLDAGTRKHYVQDLSQRGVAAVAIEVGRTFEAVPEEMVRAGSAVRLPIIELRAVVPFIDVCRAVNTAIAAREVDELRVRSTLVESLHDDLAAGAGVAPMLGHVAETLHAPVVLVSTSGALLSAHGVDDDSAAWRVVDRAVSEATVHSKGRPIARLIVGERTDDGPVPFAQSLLRAAAGPVAVGLTRTGVRGSALAARLVEDLVDARPMRPADLRARLAAAGVSVGAPTVVVPLAAEAPDPRMADAAVAGAELDSVARSIVDATVYALAAVPAGGGEGATDPVDRVASSLTRQGNRIGRTTVVVGNPCVIDDVRPGADVASALSASLRRCGRQLGLAASTAAGLEAGRRVFTSRELLVDEAIGGLDPALRTELRSLVEPLVTADGRSSSDLVRTLAVHLAHGCSATRSAAALHIGRQSLYQRLERIRTVLGFDPTDPAVYASTMLALRSVTREVHQVAHQL